METDAARPIEQLITRLPRSGRIRRNEPLSDHTTLRVGGPAEAFYPATTVEELAATAITARASGVRTFFLGSGSNLLVSDAGMPGLVVFNACEGYSVGPTTYAECGISFQHLFLKTAQQGLAGLEFAVGIPGTLGGALVSNAGAYRANICDLISEIDLVCDGERMTVSPDWMQFSYRNSRLRHTGAPQTVLLSVRLRLQPEDCGAIFARARNYQRERIRKQPTQPSAGSFFKNVTNRDIASRIDGLTEGMRAAGVVPAAFLIEACGLKGTRIGGAKIAERHANFLVNVGGASASDIRRLASLAKIRVLEMFGVQLQEEVLYAGDWSDWTETERLTP